MRTLVATFALAALPFVAQAQESGIPIGTKAPDVELETLDGGTAKLSQWVGTQPVLIEFWASWCPNCKAMEPTIEAAAERYGDRVKFIGVAVSVNQTVDRVKRYMERYNLPMTMLYDRRGDASDAYDVPATSYIVVLDAEGTVVYTGAGGNQNIDAAIQRALGG